MKNTYQRFLRTITAEPQVIVAKVLSQEGVTVGSSKPTVRLIVSSCLVRPPGLNLHRRLNPQSPQPQCASRLCAAGEAVDAYLPREPGLPNPTVFLLLLSLDRYHEDLRVLKDGDCAYLSSSSISGEGNAVVRGLAAAESGEVARQEVVWARLEARGGKVGIELAGRVSCSHGKGVRLLTWWRRAKAKWMSRCWPGAPMLQGSLSSIVCG
jgi:hypothetical protein